MPKEGMSNSAYTEEDKFIPVIIGVGQLLDRPQENEDGIEPFNLMMSAIQIAGQDANPSFLSRIDSIDIQNITSWRYPNICELLTEELNVHPKRCVYHEVSGDLPIRSLCEAAQQIANGTSEVALICGAESSWSVRHAKKLNKILSSWRPALPGKNSWIPEVSRIVRQYHLHLPVRAYALYETACRSAWNQTFQESQNETAAIQARASEIAALNEFAWIRKRKSAKTIVTPSLKNRLIAWPYTKLMVADNYVNGGTAIILTNLYLAKKAGIPSENLIYIHAGAHANEPDNILERDSYEHSAAMEAVLNGILGSTNLDIKDLDYTEMYSCFPIVTKLAKRIIHPLPHQDLTVVGGMTFCRGQLSNFMSQATVEMVKKLRRNGCHGLLYGNGHYLTHAAGMIMSNQPPSPHAQPINLNLQETANALMVTAPDLIEQYEGSGKIETYTVVFDKTGMPSYGIIVARTPENKRFAAITKPGEESGYLPLLNIEVNAIGLKGKSTRQDGYNIWTW